MDGLAPFVFATQNNSILSPPQSRWSFSDTEFVDSTSYRFDISRENSLEPTELAGNGSFIEEPFQGMDVSPKEPRQVAVLRQRPNEMQTSCKSTAHGRKEQTRLENVDVETLDLGARPRDAKRTRGTSRGSNDGLCDKIDEEAMMEEGLKKIRLPTVETIVIQVKTLNGHIIPIEYVKSIRNMIFSNILSELSWTRGYDSCGSL
jgi:hypothetical protein